MSNATSNYNQNEVIDEDDEEYARDSNMYDTFGKPATQTNQKETNEFYNDKNQSNNVNGTSQQEQDEDDEEIDVEDEIQNLENEYKQHLSKNQKKSELEYQEFTDSKKQKKQAGKSKDLQQQQMSDGVEEEYMNKFLGYNNNYQCIRFFSKQI